MCISNEIFRKLTKKILRPQNETFILNMEEKNRVEVNVCASLSEFSTF